MKTDGEHCVESIRAHLEASGLKWAQLTGPVVAQLIDKTLAIRHPKPKNGSRVNGRDILFDAIANACGVDLTSLTRNYAKQIATAKRDIMEASPGVSSDEVDRRAKAYYAKYRNAVLTPMALANRWPEFGNGHTITSKPDIYCEPKDWTASKAAQTLLHVSPETWANIVAEGWFNLSPDLRTSILKAL